VIIQSPQCKEPSHASYSLLAPYKNNRSVDPCYYWHNLGLVKEVAKDSIRPILGEEGMVIGLASLVVLLVVAVTVLVINVKF
jgi:hypothetical protein